MRRKRGLPRGQIAVGFTLLASACGGERSDIDTSAAGGGNLPEAAGGAPGAGGALAHTGGTTGSGGAFSLPMQTCDRLRAEIEPEELFGPYATLERYVARRVLYSWTSSAQIDELRADPTLLTRSMSVDGQRGRAADYILERAPFDEMAALLARPEFEKKRFGWANAWATLLGWDGEQYGDQLLEIRLRAEAFIGRLSTRDGSWAFFDTSGNAVPEATVRENPERIGAVYFTDEWDSEACSGATYGGGTYGGGTYIGTAAFREYFVCNESMIESWSAYTPELREHLQGAIAALGQFKEILENRCEGAEFVDCWKETAVADWRQWELESAMQWFNASLAFPNERYHPTAENIDRLIERLQSVLFEPAPLRHQY